ncbi:MAG: formyltetrahydrofolate deformylase [Chromatocurvus sp.]
MSHHLILTFSCPDEPGIVARVSGFIAGTGGNILESSQFGDEETGRFFMRTEFSAVAQGSFDVDALRAEFEPIAQQFRMSWQLSPADARMRIVIAVSRWGHCFNALLNNWRAGVLPVEIVAAVSNHDDMRGVSEWYGVPYHHLPVSQETRPQQEQAILRVMQDTEADLLVLARYMQILSNDLCRSLEGRAINIHHSFLPGFKGARPYHQAHARGVKLIGATAHYVTADLDEGPIIDQDVERVTHAHQPEDLVMIGRDRENAVLNRAVLWHAQRRVLLNGSRTVVFQR